MQAYQKIEGGFEPRALRDVVTKADGSRAVVRMLPRDENVAAEFGVYFVDTTAPEGRVWTGQVVADEDGKPVPVFVDIPVIDTTPHEVEGWQAEVAMKATPVDPEDSESQNVWDRVQDLIAAMPDGIEKITAQTVLARGKIRRDSPMLAQLAPLVPLSEQRVDDMFRLAGSIEA